MAAGISRVDGETGIAPHGGRGDVTSLYEYAGGVTAPLEKRM